MPVYNSVSTKLIRLLGQEKYRNCILVLSENDEVLGFPVSSDKIKLIENLTSDVQRQLDDRYTESEADEIFEKQIDLAKDVLEKVDNLKDTITKRHDHTNKSILDEIEEAFKTIEKNKLKDIEDGAQVNKLETINNRKADNKNLNLTSKDVDLSNVTNVKQIPYNYLANENHKHVATLDTEHNTIPLDQIPESIRSGLKYHCGFDASEGKWPDEVDPPPDKEVDMFGDPKKYESGALFIITKVNEEHKIHDKEVEVGYWLIRNRSRDDDPDRWDVVALKGIVYSVNGKSGIVVLNKKDIGLENVKNIDTTNADNINTGKTNKILSLNEFNDIVFSEELLFYLKIEDLEEEVKSLDFIKDLVKLKHQHGDGEKGTLEILNKIEEAYTTDEKNRLRDAKSFSGIKINEDKTLTVKDLNKELIIKPGKNLTVSATETEDGIELYIDAKYSGRDFKKIITKEDVIQGKVTVSHDLNTRFISPILWDNSGEYVIPEMRVINRNTVLLDIEDMEFEEDDNWRLMLTAIEDFKKDISG